MAGLVLAGLFLLAVSYPLAALVVVLAYVGVRAVGARRGR